MPSRPPEILKSWPGTPKTYYRKKINQMSIKSTTKLSRHQSALQQKYVDEAQTRVEARKFAFPAIIRERLQVQVGAAGGNFRDQEMIVEVAA